MTIIKHSHRLMMNVFFISSVMCKSARTERFPVGSSRELRGRDARGSDGGCLHGGNLHTKYERREAVRQPEGAQTG